MLMCQMQPISTLALFFVVWFSFGCSTTYVPLKSSVDRVTVKIDNPDKNKNYNLFNSRDKNGIVGKVQNDEGLITYDISNFSRAYDNCYSLHDGEKFIPIKNKDKTFRFINPAIDPYLSLYNQRREADNKLNEYKEILNKSVAYRNEQCIVLSSKDMPIRPSSSCDPTEHEEFSINRCKSAEFNPTLLDRVQNAAICGAIGGVLGFVNVFLGAGAGYVCDWYKGKTDEERKFMKCIDETIRACSDTYEKWLNNVNYLSNNATRLYNDCINTIENINDSAITYNKLNKELVTIASNWYPITDENLCK